MNIEDYYFIRSDDDKFSALESMLKETGIEVQYSFPYIGTIAAKIEDKKIVEMLVQKGYAVESQNRLSIKEKKP